MTFSRLRCSKTRWPRRGLAWLSTLGLLACSPGWRCGHSTAPTQGDASRPDAPGAALVLTTPQAPFVRSQLGPAPASSTADVVVNARETLQVIRGFGGAFNEQGWVALSVLATDERDRVLRSLFDPREGLRFDLCRIPIGASDYALDRYTLDETPGDYAMAYFSLERDRERLIPYIQAARRIRPDLKFWASAWTPPTWMKTNGSFDGGTMRQEPRIYSAYALYLAKFVEGYRAEGIGVSMVVPQNEPNQLTRYPSCGWTPAQYVVFIRDHLGPLLQTRHLDTRIFAGTINRRDWDVLSVLRDPGAARFISGVALQWDGLAQVAEVHQAFPELPIMQSETECGNHHTDPLFNPERPPNDFRYAAHTWRKFRDFLAAGSSSYLLWNMVLDERGKNLDTVKPWPQNSAIVVERTTGRVTYTPMYWVTKHFSGLLEPGARLVRSYGRYQDRIAFLNPDGSVVVELLNAGAAPAKLTVAEGARTYAVSLPGQSFATVLVPRAQP